MKLSLSFSCTMASFSSTVSLAKRLGPPWKHKSKRKKWSSATWHITVWPSRTSSFRSARSNLASKSSQATAPSKYASLWQRLKSLREASVKIDHLSRQIVSNGSNRYSETRKCVLVSYLASTKRSLPTPRRSKFLPSSSKAKRSSTKERFQKLTNHFNMHRSLSAYLTRSPMIVLLTPVR